MRRILVGLSAGAAVLAVCSAPVAAHTDSNLVAAPAGGTATLVLQPTHGCGEAPTIEVAIRAPLEGATPGTVDGWNATAAEDGNGNTVLTWTGGELPADVTGEFPISFTVPDAVGELLLFPSVQTCADGQTLRWIDGNPEGEYPAPRLLVLPPGSEPAATIDDVPADAPGREQLVEIVDVDAAAGTSTPTTQAPSTTIPPATEPVPSPVSSTAAPAPAVSSPPTTGVAVPTSVTTVAASSVADDDSIEESDESSSSTIFAIVALVATVVVGGAIIAARRRS